MIFFYDPLKTTANGNLQPPFCYLGEPVDLIGDHTNYEQIGDYHLPYSVFFHRAQLEEHKHQVINIIWPSFIIPSDFQWELAKYSVSSDIHFVAQNYNIKFYFNAYDTGITATQLLEQIIKIIQYFGVNPEDIIIVTGNTYERFILEQMLIGKGILGVTYETGDREIVNAINEYQAYLRSYKNRFNFFCRKNIPWRSLIFFDLIRREILPKDKALLNESVYSWGKFDTYTGEEYDTREVIERVRELLQISSNKEYFDVMDSWIVNNAKEICDNSPYTLKGEMYEKKDATLGEGTPPEMVAALAKLPAMIQDTRNSFANAVNSSSVSLTIETLYDHTPSGYVTQDVFHLTEKTIRAMCFKQPFFIYAMPTFLAKMRVMGFQTFGDFWDESYDNEYDPLQRMLKINDQVERLNKMPIDEFHDLIAQTSDVTNHNYKKMWDLNRHYIADAHQKIKSKGLIWNNILIK